MHSKRGLWRPLLVLTAAVLIFTSLGSTLASVAGRDFSRCVQGCNAIRKSCDAIVTDDCRAMFPGTPNKPARDACIAAGKAVCLVDSDECKLMCQAIKNPPTFEEP